MKPIAVTLVIEPPPLDFVGIYEPARTLFAFDEFASAVAEGLGSEVPIVESTLAAAEVTGLILLSAGIGINDYLATPEGIEARSRIVMLNVSRTHVLSTLDWFGLAGAIESYRYSRWQRDRSHEFGGQVYGKRDIVVKAGAEIEEGFSSEHYALFDAPNTTDLPSALAWYLQQYWSAR